MQFLLLMLPLISLLNCVRHDTEKVGVKSNQKLGNKNKFIPDTTVNNILHLNNFESSVRFLSSINELTPIEKERESPILLLTDRTHSKYLLLYQFEGATLSSFSKFEIINATSYFPESNPTETIYEDFVTESGLKLNMSMEEVIVMKGNNFVRDNNSRIIYRVDADIESNFLKRYNMPGYSMECDFKEGRLYKLVFGFDYP
jgi:hypothetical protein